VRCGAVRCGAVRCGAVHAEYTKQRQQRPYSQRKGLIYCESLSFHFSVSLCLIVCCIWFWIWICMDTCWPGFLKARQAGASCTNNCFCLSFIQTFHVAIELNTFAQSPPCRSCTALPDANLRCFVFLFHFFCFCFLFSVFSGSLQCALSMSISVALPCKRLTGHDRYIVRIPLDMPCHVMRVFALPFGRFICSFRFLSDATIIYCSCYCLFHLQFSSVPSEGLCQSGLVVCSSMLCSALLFCASWDSAFPVLLECSLSLVSTP